MFEKISRPNYASICPELPTKNVDYQHAKLSGKLVYAIPKIRPKVLVKIRNAPKPKSFTVHSASSHDGLWPSKESSPIMLPIDVPVTEVISTSFYELNKKLYFFFWLYQYRILAKISRKSIHNTAHDIPVQKYRRYRYRYCESIPDKVSVSVPILTSLGQMYILYNYWSWTSYGTDICQSSLVLYSSSYTPLLSVLSYLILQQTTTSMLMILNFSYHSQLWISLITSLTLKTL